MIVSTNTYSIKLNHFIISMNLHKINQKIIIFLIFVANREKFKTKTFQNKMEKLRAMQELLC